jgi:hypothetical protein
VPHVTGVPKDYAALFREAAVTSLRSHKARAEEAEPCAAAPLWLQRTRYGEELSRPYHPECVTAAVITSSSNRVHCSFLAAKWCKGPPRGFVATFLLPL